MQYPQSLDKGTKCLSTWQIVFLVCLCMLILFSIFVCVKRSLDYSLSPADDTLVILLRMQNVSFSGKPHYNIVCLYVSLTLYSVSTSSAIAITGALSKTIQQNRSKIVLTAVNLCTTCMAVNGL